MKETIKTIFIIYLLSAQFASYSQHNTSSPYSRYGLGELFPKTFGQSKGMGGVAIGINSSDNLNIKNPASYSYIPMQSFIFEAGLDLKYSKFSATDWSKKMDDINISYLTMGFPITKWMGGCFGLIPFSQVGYDVKSHQILHDDKFVLGEVTSQYQGSGGIYQVFIGNSVRFLKYFSAGYNASYLFGRLNQVVQTDFSDANYSSSILKTTNNTQVNDFYFNLGLQYTYLYKEKVKYTLGIIFDNKQDIKANRTTETLRYLNYNGIDTANVCFTDTLSEGNITLPQNLGVGFTIKTQKFLVGLDYYQQNWANAKFFGSAYPNFTKSDNINLGVEFTPDYRAIKYWKVIRYRFGVHYSNNYLQVLDADNQYNQLKDYGLSIGAEIPIRNSGTLFNVALEFGKKNTGNSNLMEEQYIQLHINISMHDIWFRKYKFM
jgi:hypothetical protein